MVTKKTTVKKTAAKKSTTKKATAKKATTKKVAKKTATTSAVTKKIESVAKKATTSKKEVAKVAPVLETVEVVDNATKKISKEIIQATLLREKVITEASDFARELFNTRAFGTILDDGRLQLTLTEGFYLLEKKRIRVYDGKKNLLDLTSYATKASKVEPTFWVRYAVYKDMRNRGYVVKTALKFGADFRVYDRGIKPGEDHARWIVYPVHEGERYTWFDFAAKNRVAHSTKKRLLMGVVDGENDVTYWEIKWVRP